MAYVNVSCKSAKPTIPFKRDELEQAFYLVDSVRVLFFNARINLALCKNKVMYDSLYECLDIDLNSAKNKAIKNLEDQLKCIKYAN